jgi:amino acid permease
MKKVPKWFKIESVLMVLLMIVLTVMQSAISIVPGHEQETYRVFQIAYLVLIIIWIISIVIVLAKKRKKTSQ